MTEVIGRGMKVEVGDLVELNGHGFHWGIIALLTEIRVHCRTSGVATYVFWGTNPKGHQEYLLSEHQVQHQNVRKVRKL